MHPGSWDKAYHQIMGMFNNLLSKIFGHASAAASATPAPSNTTIESAVAPATAAPATTPDAAAVPVQTTDVNTILDGLAAKNSEKLDWKKSIVDLLKLVDMDSSLSARRQLAKELHYPGDENDSATMNVWLHKQVLRELSEHGGKIPRELL
jgi:3-oxoacyl-ACP reductase-like protein